MNYSFDVDVATKYGVNEAILIGNLQFWLLKNKANKTHCYDDRTWTYNSIQAFATLFPFWTAKQVRRVLDSLISKEVIVTGNYNKSAYDRTLWYAFNDESKWLGGFAQNENSKSPNGKIDLPIWANGNAQKGEPIPNINTDINTDRKPDSKQKICATIDSNATSFERFWDVYPKKKSKESARKAWAKLKPDEQLQQTIIDAVLQAKTQDADWLKDGGQFVPHASTFLNGKRWEDEIAQKSPGAAKSNNRGLKQPPEYPDYSVLWEGDNFIDSTAQVIIDEPKRL